MKYEVESVFKDSPYEIQHTDLLNRCNIQLESMSLTCLRKAAPLSACLCGTDLPQKVSSIQKLKSQTKEAPVAGMTSMTSTEPSEKLHSRGLHISFPIRFMPDLCQAS